MSIWSNNAKGVFLYSDLKDKVTAQMLKNSGVNFVIADAGEGSSYKDSFATFVQMASDANIPCLLYYKPDMFYPYQEWPQQDKSRWSADRALSVIDRAMGSPRRLVHGIILDMNWIYWTEAKQYIDHSWLSEIGNYLMDNIWKRYKINQYVYLTKDTVDYYDKTVDASKNTIPVWIDGMGSLCVWKSSADTPESVPMNWNNFPIPDDDDAPREAVTYAPKWDFWKYSNTKYTVSSTRIPLWLYNTTKEKLYNNLGFVPKAGDVVNPPPPVDDDGTNEGGNDNENDTSYKDYTSLLSDILVELRKITKHLNPM